MSKLAVGALAVLAWPLAATVLPNGLPLGVVVFGAVFGSLYALTAIGLVLVYRANRVVNFAQAELGVVGAILTVQLVNQRGWNWLVAVFTGLAIACVVGAGVEAAVIRRFHKAPRLILSVATIGVAQVLAGLALVLALLIRGGSPRTLGTTTSGFTFEIQPVIFRRDHLLAMVTVPVALALLALFLRRTGYGVAVRAAADNGDRAGLLGIPVKRVSTMVWTIAALLSAIAVVFRASIVGFNPTAVSGGGNALLLRALACAVVGRMESLPVAAAAAVGLGVVEQAAFWSWGSGAIVDGFLFVVILVVLLVQRAHFSRVVEAGFATGTWRAIREVRPVPTELRRLPEVRIGTWALGVACAAAVLLFPAFATPDHEQLMTLLFIYAMIAVSLVVLTGWAGQISLGHFALVGFGGATMAVLYDRHGWDVLAAIPAGVLVAAAVSFLVGLPALRIRGPFLAVTTLAFAVSASYYFLEDRYFPWFVDPTIDRPVLWGRLGLELDWQMYYLCAAVLLLVIVAVRGLRRSHTGRAIIAMRDNELAAQSVALDATRLKLTAFVVSGTIAGLAGCLYVLQQHGLQTGSFNSQVSVRLFSMVVIGGLGSVPGAVLGAVYVRGAEFFLPPAWQLIASGVGILVLLMLVPGGLGDLLYRTRDVILRAVARRRGLVVPSLVADVGVIDAGVRAPAGDRPEDALLSVEDVDVAYDGVQVLFGVTCYVRDGELVALLGTNGAGKSTLLKAISGLVEPSAGRIVFDARDITRKGCVATARLGITQMPGGRGIFPSLTVGENLRMAAWLYRRDAEYVRAARSRVLDEYFPELRALLELPAGNLSGGQQQMLSLAQALIARPKLLLIDELSLGLAPTVVDRLLDVVRAIHASGTTVVIVEQSVNTALRLAGRAMFMEKGEIRFDGPASELLGRRDVLRAVFLQGAAAFDGNGARGRRRVAQSSSTVVLRAEGLVKRYGGITAVDEVDLELRKGEILGLIGPNGAGKTTLYDLVSGFQAADRGLVLLRDEDITQWPAHVRARAGLGRSFQDARLWPSLTVREALAVALARSVEVASPLAAMAHLPVVGDSERRVARRVEELIELMHLGAFRDKFVAELSTGSRRIVEIAAMVAHRPYVLLLDEPSSGIAQRETEALGPLLRNLRDELDCSLLVIEHDMPLITQLAGRIVALDRGRVIAEGSPREVTRHPKVVESYLGTSFSAGRRSRSSAVTSGRP